MFDHWVELFSRMSTWDRIIFAFAVIVALSLYVFYAFWLYKKKNGLRFAFWEKRVAQGKYATSRAECCQDMENSEEQEAIRQQSLCKATNGIIKRRVYNNPRNKRTDKNNDPHSHLEDSITRSA